MELYVYDDPSAFKSRSTFHGIIYRVPELSSTKISDSEGTRTFHICDFLDAITSVTEYHSVSNCVALSLGVMGYKLLIKIYEKAEGESNVDLYGLADAMLA